MWVPYTACHSTDVHTHDSNDCYNVWVLLLRLVNSERHWNCTAHFRYRGTIEYRDTRDGIVIIALISGIAQLYLKQKLHYVFIYSMLDFFAGGSLNTRPVEYQLHCFTLVQNDEAGSRTSLHWMFQAENFQFNWWIPDRTWPETWRDLAVCLLTKLLSDFDIM